MKNIRLILALNVALSVGAVRAETFSINFLGGAANDPVTNSAGVVATTAWNNLTNGFTGAITADNATAATLALTGNGGGWKSGLVGDGANASLLNGYLDNGQGFSNVVTIGNLVGDSYDVYLYTVGDGAKPGNGGDWQPNYKINSTTYYTSIQGPTDPNGYAGIFVESGVSLTNSNIIPTPVMPYGNYIKIANVVPVNQVITIIGEADNQTWRSPLNGVQLVRKTGTTFGIKFLGSTTDSVTNTAGVVPTPNWINVTNGFSGPIEADNSTTATLTLSGAAGMWNSGIVGDGGNQSLLHGFLDTGANIGKGIVTISDLTGGSYTIYIYCLSDFRKPDNSGDWQPNYDINGTVYYTSIQGGAGPSAYAGTFVEGGLSPTNTNVFPTPVLPYGNYFRVAGVAPVGGVITITAQADNQSWRSPLNGVQLVRETGPVVATLTATPGTNAYAGSPITLAVSATGVNPAFQWRADGGTGGSRTNIPGATGTNYIVNTALLSAGIYKYDVVITNIAGSVTSAPITLVISAASAPFITTDTTATPTNQLAVGQPVKFMAAFNGTQNIGYQWQANTGGGYTNIPGATTTSLSLNNIQSTDAGSYRLVASNSVGTNASTPLVLTVLNPAQVSEIFAINFLGNAVADPVVMTAGVVPTAVWNNLPMGYNGTITANNSTTASVVMSGTAGGWNSAAIGDGANYSLLHGFFDAGQNNSGIATISGLTGVAYDVYLYTLTDVQRPSNNGDWQPNYDINGTTYYTSVMGVGAFTNNLLVEGGIGFVNTNAYPPEVGSPYATYGNYIKVANVVPVSGAITVTAGIDSQTFRSPLNGIELVRSLALKITQSGANVIVSWPTNYTGFTLKGKSVINTGTWNPVTPGPSVVGANYQVTVPHTNLARYFRLENP